MMMYEGIRDRVQEYRVEYNQDCLKESRQVHNFSLSSMISYCYLNEMLNHKRLPLLLQGNILIIPSKQGRYKTFCYKEVPESQKSLLEFLQTLGTIYSIDRIPFLGEERESQFTEVMYNLDTLFDPRSYPSTKKRSQRIYYPFNQIEKYGITHTPINEDNFAKVKELHQEWVEMKMNDPNTFRMMFPTGRYLRCCKLVLDSPKDFKGYAFWGEKKLIAARVVGISEKEFVPDLASFGRTWDMPVNGMMEYIDIVLFRDLRDLGYKKLSCGVTLNKRLKMFKTHFPYELVTSWKYSRNKEVG